MAFFDRTKIITSVLIFSVALSGCSIPFFGKGSRISPDNVYDALAEYDCEDYDDLDEMTGDTENKRALEAGLFISLEGKYIRHALNEDAFNILFEQISEDYIYNLYSKSINKATLMVRGEETRDGGTIRFSLLSAEFDDDEDAWKYYNTCNDIFSELAEGENVQSYKDHFEDGKLECTATQIYMFKSASCLSAYIEGRNVMIMTGYESKCNDITDELGEYAGLLEIPFSDMSRWDCLATPDVEDRVLLMIDELEMEYVDPDDFSDVIDMDDSGMNAYTECSDAGDMTDLMDVVEGYEDRITMMRAAYRSAVQYSAYYVVSYTMDSEGSASDMYDHAVSTIVEDSRGEMNDTETGETGGIRYTKLSGNSLVEVRYSIYLEGDMVYLVGAMSLRGNSAEDLHRECIDILGLP